MHCAGVEEEEAAEATKAPTETKVLWGPVTKQVTDAIGAPAAVASVLLRTSSATAEVAARMKALVPVNILPTAGDTPKSLAARLAQSEYLHPKFVLSKGNGTGRLKYIDLNSTQYAQPRRVRWGVPMEVDRPQHEHETSIVRLPCYPHSYARSPLDATCEVVPDAVYINSHSYCVEGGTTVPRTELGVCTTQLLGTVLLLHCLTGSNGEAPGQLQI